MIIITVPEATPFLSFNQFSFTQTLSCTHLLAPSVLLSSPSTCSPSISHGIFITPSTPLRHMFLPVPPVFSSNTCRTKPPFSISLISSRDRSSCSCWCTTVSSDDVILQEQYKQRCKCFCSPSKQQHEHYCRQHKQQHCCFHPWHHSVGTVWTILQTVQTTVLLLLSPVTLSWTTWTIM